MRVSIRQADLCCFEVPLDARLWMVNEAFQSAKRICAVSKGSTMQRQGAAHERLFQSAKRICAVSKSSLCWDGSAYHGFNPPSGFVLFRSLDHPRPHPGVHRVSIRQADLCCFEATRSSPLAQTICRFNPPSGFVLFRSYRRYRRGPGRFVSIRQADLCCFEGSRRGHRLSYHPRRFNPPSGFVLFRRTVRPSACGGERSFNPPSGFVLFRSLRGQSWMDFCAWVSIRQADLCCFEASKREIDPAKMYVSIRQADLCCFEENYFGSA